LKYLIDTQILIWFYSEAKKIPLPIVNIIQNPENNLAVSVASFWEIAIKSSLGKLKLPFDLPQMVEETLSNNIDILGIEVAHIFEVSNLPFHHSDPFDRIIISQAISENISIISSDKEFDNYNVKRIW